MMNTMQKSHLAILLSNISFGIVVPLMKVLDGQIDPLTLTALRSVCAAPVFWALASLTKDRRPSPRHLLTIGIGAFLGFLIPQLLTMLSVQLTSPVYTSLALACTPIISLFIAAALRRESITLPKLGGILLALTGAAIIILYGQGQGIASSRDIFGILIALGASLCIAVYYIVMRTVSQTYSSATQMKWTFLISAIATLPILVLQLPSQPICNNQTSAATWGALAIVILVSTILTYWLMPLGMANLTPTAVSIYANLQPIVASALAIMLGQDTLTFSKVIAAVLVIAGAYIVATQNNEKPEKPKKTAEFQPNN